MFRTLIITLITLICPLMGSSQVLEGRFITYKVAEGMTAKQVNVVTEDVTGYIWVGTQEGLNRFDGVEFKQYLKDDGERAVVGNFISALHPLADGRLIVGTYRNGTCIYNPATDDFTDLTATASDSIEYRSVFDIDHETDSTVLISYRRGILFKGGLTRLNVNTLEETPLAEDRIISLLDLVPGKSPGTWWGVGRDLTEIDLSGDSIEVKEYEFAIRQYDSGRYYEALHWHGDTLMIGTWSDGVVLFDRAKERFLTKHFFNLEDTTDYASNAVRCFKPRGDGSYWIATADKGVGVYRPDDASFAFFEHDNDDPYSIPYISAREVFVDSRGILWASMAGGLSMLNDQLFQIGYTGYGLPEGATNTRTYSLKQAAISGEYLFVATAYGPGVMRLDKNSGEFIDFVGTKEQTDNGLPISAVELQSNDDGRVFIMSRAKLWELDPQSGRARILYNIYRDEAFPGVSGAVNTIRLDGEVIWFGTDNNLFGRYNLTTGSADTWWLHGEGPANGPNLVFEIDVADNGDVWIAANYGVYRWRDGELMHLGELSPDYAPLGSLVLESLAVSDTLLFCGTKDEGLYTFSTNTFEGVVYGRKQGLPNMRVAELAVDTAGRVWGITDYGLFSFDQRNPSPLTVYTEVDGLHYVSIGNDEISSLSDGRVIIGYSRGLGWINPEELTTNPMPEQLVLTASLIQGEPVSARKRGMIEVPYGQSLELGFRAIGFTKPESYTYSYRIDGGEWIRLTSPRLLFSSMVGQDFTLELSASNQQGERMKSPLLIDVDIVRPFYLEQWFQLLVAVALLALIVFAYRRRVRNIREREALRTAYNQKLAEVEMSALRAQMNPHFLFNCLNSIKFFIINKETEAASDYLTKFSRLIRLILSNSKSEVIPLSNELEALRLYVELEALRFDQQFNFTMEVADDVQTEFIEVPPMVIQPFVENAIWHGLLHKDGQGNLRVSVAVEDGELLCEIEDDGVGRERAAALKSKSATREKSMGMDITRNRLTRMKHSGTGDRRLEIIDLTAADGSAGGTLVRIRIPI
jgi:ligand-binding sensor domain-containing protein/anti-sigma regulatory factor (Ser/Thr protein kinase)